MSTQQKLAIVRFAPRGKDSFYETVSAGVNSYFSENGISPYANSRMWVKTIAMMMLYFVPYGLVVSGFASFNAWFYISLWVVMGFGMCGLGTSVMHDANHGAYSDNKYINNILSHILEFVGGYTKNWRIQHNILHHTYTNISGLDEDIETRNIIRLSPQQTWKPMHRYQHYYAWLFYMISTLYWITAKDFIAAVKYKKHGLLTKQKITFKEAIRNISLYKVFYFTYALVVPLVFSNMPWYITLLGFLLMHFTAGLFLTCIFQVAHVMEDADFPAPVEVEGKRKMEETWAVHEMATTVNFAPKSRILSWFIGGLNYQVEHHLFSNICHVHYPKLAPIVQRTAAAYGIPYYVQPTFAAAIKQHAKMLKKLGNSPQS